MMKSMRENTKIILWIVVGAFLVTIFAVWGLDLQTGGGQGANRGVLGKVNEVTITRQMYQNVYNQMAKQYRQSTPGGDLTATQEDMLRESAWDNIVNNVVTNEQVKKLGITVTDPEILSFLRNSPPPEIQKYFKNDKGNFDYAAYQKALNNPNADWTGVEQLARERIPLIKLNQYLAAQVHVGAWEVRRQFEAENTKMLARYVRFPIDSGNKPDTAPTDEELKAYYSQHAEDFREPERAVIDYVRIPIAPTPGDRSDLTYTINSIHDQLTSGEDFATLAHTYSEAFSARVDGDAGFVDASQRPASVMKAVASLADGAVSSPIYTKDGAYIVRRIESRKSKGKKQYHIAEIFVRLTAGSSTRDSLRTIATNVHDAAASGTFDDAARARGLRVEHSEPFAKDMPVGDLGLVPSISRFAFEAKPGQISNVITSDKAYSVVRLDHRMPAAIPPLAKIHDRVAAALLADRRVEAARHRAEAFARKFDGSSTSFANAAAQYGLTIATTDTFGVQTPLPGIPAGSPFQWAALDAPVGKPTPAVQGRNAFFVLDVSYRSPFQNAAFQAGAGAVRRRLLTKKAQQYVTWWFGKLRDDAHVQDYRNVY